MCLCVVPRPWPGMLAVVLEVVVRGQGCLQWYWKLLSASWCVGVVSTSMLIPTRRFPWRTHLEVRLTQPLSMHIGSIQGSTTGLTKRTCT